MPRRSFFFPRFLLIIHQEEQEQIWGFLPTGSGVAFSFGSIQVRWYGLIITTAVIVGYAVANRRAKARGQDPEHLINILIYGLISAIVGARLYYVLFNLSQYAPRPAEALAVWHGGLAIHGALIGGIISTIVYTRRHKLNFWYWADIMAPSIILGQAIGRWGNFMNQEAFGAPTRLPWAIYIEPARRPADLLQFSYFHPTFLYESLWNWLGFGVLIYLSRLQGRHPKAWPDGSIFLAYGIFYSAGRLFIEGLRTDSLMLGPIRVAQLASVLIIIACSVIFLRRRGAA